MKAKINSLINYDFDKYENLFQTFIYITKTLYNKGALREHYENDKILTNYESSKKILLNMIDLLCDARCPSILNLINDLESTKYIKQAINEEELQEIVLSKSFVKFLLDHDFDAIYEMIQLLCTDTLFFKLLPSHNWLA